MDKPNIKPKNPNFSSGPCPKRPGWDISDIILDILFYPNYCNRKNCCNNK